MLEHIAVAEDLAEYFGILLDDRRFGMAALFGGEVPGLSDNDLRAALKRLANGLPLKNLTTCHCGRC